jgi:hypothetical protein
VSTRYTPEPSQIDYHADAQAQRVARAKALIDLERWELVSCLQPPWWLFKQVH